ncbi:MAG: 50S ribosomal protein L22 [Ilumatobacter coccineus]|uniref:Large ribosomal subunit protein uL22 n=1 Tax=Ilumatobacter coccineus TaxID=467094 RepID=A0A2G6KGG6_9ACTN|nr:MAG: 50S ribosomal protein L22 [Ilumatobacter coccineus]
MRGPKRNEGATVIGERHGTKATAKHVRSSATKARVVLDLIRGLDVAHADQVLHFTDRSIARDIRKVLASAVANASNPDNTGSYIGDAEELFVSACFADEGPTMRRFRPRARGRATRIRKRTCHITVVVDRMSEERIEILRARAEGAQASQASSRRARVERSRKRAQEAAEAATHDETSTDEATAEVAFEAGEWEGSVLPDAEGNGPDTHPIKGNADSMLYHTPDSRYYKVTKAEVWFDSEASAEAAGFSKPGTQKDED